MTYQIYLNENSKYDLDNKKLKKLKKFLKEFYGQLTLNNLEGVEYYPKHIEKENQNILTLKYENGKEYLYTHNMVGEIYYNDELKVSIGLRFEKEEYSVLEYLLNIADSFYLNENILNYNPNSIKKKTNTLSEFILFKMFINSLKKAVIFGFPFSYSTNQEKDYNIKGSIDIKRLYSQEIPFKGKTPYIKNERKIVTSIALVLLNAINYIILNKNYKDPTLNKIKNDLMQYNLNIPLNKSIIQKALNHNILNNPLYSEYKQTLYFAKVILENNNTNFKKLNKKNIFYGYLVDISKIWENFIANILTTNINNEWQVKKEEPLKLFKKIPYFDNNTKNEMRPDIVMYHKYEKKVIIFDAKFKRSVWFNRDDFYKTATYISYYQNKGYDVVLAGQIYPDKTLNEINKNIGFLDSNIDFRFFGIDLSDITQIQNEIKKFIDIVKGKIDE